MVTGAGGSIGSELSSQLNSLLPKNLILLDNSEYNLFQLRKKIKEKYPNTESNKINYIYILTPRGISEKAKLTLNFMKRKMKEYDELKKEMKK